ncbi:hypothetical protein RhiirC2_827375 [Rhizophagus irregularis]|uniref:Uncharacterized protein n=1 Tax=Rhizophagus irregularis TaxID=588596 RepID=A0A2N1NCQ7_9GLOM|nr:hypothetical protein RhiirC2_827375 [Rhizophagus irregularis]
MALRQYFYRHNVKTVINLQINIFISSLLSDLNSFAFQLFGLKALAPHVCKNNCGLRSFHKSNLQETISPVYLPGSFRCHSLIDRVISTSGSIGDISSTGFGVILIFDELVDVNNSSSAEGHSDSESSPISTGRNQKNRTYGKSAKNQTKID